ncbi:hypothetical protein O0I10_001860 [Lichtheimia ornata]|uniref:C2 domain-containing protein n=1 Tax=Lichtheimia ornata TaxID=688661 RepID=A0AAD7Y2S6_9FUNG|nr:uncharacterized protein O0I10_001860 [Lichtheimia ornata]KAJ8662167.1 hypothetical protein O0I10_001860 [Lichtheimia ornata]
MLSENESLRVIVHSAHDLMDVETMGKQDPYVQMTLNPHEKDAFQRTEVKKDAGKQASWNQQFEFARHGEHNLFVELMDAEKGIDELIGFAAIPLDQAPINGIFELYNVTGKVAGTLHLSINTTPAEEESEPISGKTYANEEHLKRVKNLRNKGIAGDVGAALLTGALAAGAGFLGQKLYQQHEKKKQQDQEGEETSKEQ